MDNHSFTTGSLPAMKSLLILQEVLFRIQGSILFCLGGFLSDKDKHDHSQYFFFNLPEQKAQVHFADQNLYPIFHYMYINHLGKKIELILNKPGTKYP